MAIATGALIGLGIASAAGGVASSAIQAHAAGKAAQQQQQAADRALALQQQMYQQTRSDLAPYMGAGTQGLTSLTSLLGLPAAPAAAAPAPLGQGATVLLRAPDGTQQAVPAALAGHYLSRGATRVG